MSQPVWETLLADAGGTLVTAGVGAVAAWLAHRHGKLAPVAGKLGAWLLAHSGTIEVDAGKAAQVLLDLLAKKGVDPAAIAPQLKAAAIPQGQVLQGDAGFHGAAAVETPGVGGGAGGQSGSGGTVGAGGPTAGPGSPRG